jgi:hypothetical protein
MQQLNHDLAPIAIVKHESPEVAALDRRLETLRAAVVVLSREVRRISAELATRRTVLSPRSTAHPTALRRSA